MGLAPHLLLFCIDMTLQNPNLVTFNLASVFDFENTDFFYKCRLYSCVTSQIFKIIFIRIVYL